MKGQEKAQMCQTQPEKPFKPNYRAQHIHTTRESLHVIRESLDGEQFHTSSALDAAIDILSECRSYAESAERYDATRAEQERKVKLEVAFHQGLAGGLTAGRNQVKDAAVEAAKDAQPKTTAGVHSGETINNWKSRTDTGGTVELTGSIEVNSAADPVKAAHVIGMEIVWPCGTPDIIEANGIRYYRAIPLLD